MRFRYLAEVCFDYKALKNLDINHILRPAASATLVVYDWCELFSALSTQAI